MKNFTPLLCGLALAAGLFGCSEPGPDIAKFEGFTQGTSYHISYWSETPVDAKALESSVNKALADIDKNLSNYRPDSVIEKFNGNPSADSQFVGDEIVALIKVAGKVGHASQGCYDLTIKPLFDLWGFQGDALSIPDEAVLQNARAEIGLDKVAVVDDTHLRKPAGVRIDVSSVAQGYSVEKISRIMERQGVPNYLVEIGGELKTHGHKPDGSAWRIAVEKPLPGEQRLLKVLTVPKDQPFAVMTSGTYRHYFDVNGQRYSHILDARTGKPVTHDLVAVTVLHEDPTVADAWSTALLCVGQQQGMQLANEEHLKVLFIQQQGDALVETKSQALEASGLSFE
ncbi:MAG: FAD:protein FMN transferase [Methylomonas sp.]|jgi:thiamine biosynthesis lipoprotein|uniref:FAD:protein FMN transferase n=1 Tax=Methylomonas sp. TaxID=418 RepID=UPI0025E3003B|nr:FAD:protein FMN transferase [Methylomonas sp.]MCK9608104.1 FAD:protein FMN transferase [Methylomonas sp.]